MKCIILYDAAGRMRIHAALPHMSLSQADILEYYLRALDGVSAVSVYDRTCDAVITYSCARADLVRALAAFAFTEETAALVPAHTGRALNREFQNKLLLTVTRRYLRR